MNDQVESLMETLLAVRDRLGADVPDSLLREIVSAHAGEPDNPTIHRRVDRAIENLVGGNDASN